MLRIPFFDIRIKIKGPSFLWKDISIKRKAQKNWFLCPSTKRNDPSTKRNDHSNKRKGSSTKRNDPSNKRNDPSKKRKAKKKWFLCPSTKRNDPSNKRKGSSKTKKTPTKYLKSCQKPSNKRPHSAKNETLNGENGHFESNFNLNLNSNN